MESVENAGLRGRFERTRNRAASGAHKGIDRASGAIHPAVDRLTASAHQAVDSLDDAAARSADVLATKGEQLRDAQSRFAERCCSRICERPLSSLGIAIAGGFLLALLFRRR